MLAFTPALFVVEHSHHIDKLLIGTQSIFAHQTLQRTKRRVQVVDSPAMHEFISLSFLVFNYSQIRYVYIININIYLLPII